MLNVKLYYLNRLRVSVHMADINTGVVTDGPALGLTFNLLFRAFVDKAD